MRVSDLISLLCTYQEGHGPDARIAIPRSSYQREVAAKTCEDPQFGEEIFLYSGNISTYLDSRGPEVVW
jgi:hypothetical protein